MKSWQRLAMLAAVGLVVVGWAGLRTHPQAAEKAQAAGWEALVGAAEAKSGPSWSYTVEPDEKLRQKMAKTAISSGVYGGGATLELTVWGGQTPLAQARLAAPGMMFRMIYQEIVGTNYHYSFFLEEAEGVPGGEWTNVLVPIPADGDEATYSWTFVWSFTGAKLQVTSGSNPIGDKGATHSKEMIVTEEWVLAGADITGSVTGDCGVSLQYTHPSSVVSMSMTFDDLILTEPGIFPVVDNTYVAISDVQFCGNPINTTAYPTMAVQGPEHNATESSWVRSDGTSGFEFYFNGNVLGTEADNWAGVTVRSPYSHDFGNCRAYFMDGREYDPVVHCEALRVLDADGNDLRAWSGRLSVLRALGRVTQSSGCNSWDTRDPDVTGDVRMYLDRNSAEADGIEVGFGRPDLKVEGAGWLAPRVNGLYNPETPSPVDGDYWEDGEHNGEPVYVNGNGFKIWCKEAYTPTWAIGYGPGTATAYEQDGSGPQGAYLYGDLPNLVWNPDVGDWDPMGEDPPPIGYTSLDPLPAVSSNNSGTLASAGVPSFSHDLTWIFDGHTLAAASRTESPYVTDIITLAHDADKGIFGNAHSVADFVPHGAGTTAPNANGRFTLATPGDYLRLDLKENFTGRQALVGVVNAIPVPTAYWVRRHDGQLGSGDPAETAEAVYCWLGWGYLHIPVWLKDTAITVTTRVSYYDDVGGAGDNHKTDSTRQTEYTYSAGTLHTLTRSCMVMRGIRETRDGDEWWSATVVVDLHDANSLAVVTALEIEFDLGGVDYIIGEPVLAADSGDPNESNESVVTSLLGDCLFGEVQYGGGPDNVRDTGRPAPSGNGAAFKAFENWRYAEGGFSGHFDGMYRRALWNLDNHKANAVERTVGYLNPLYGAKTGVDMTSCLSVGALAGLITACSDAWTANFSQSAQDAAFVDVDDVALKVPAGSDIMPTMNSGMGGVAIANRVYSITAVSGLPYTHYGVHYVTGRAHGMMIHPVTGLRRRNAGNVAMLRRDASLPDAAWMTADGGYRSDEHAHWESKALAIAVNGPQHKARLYEYAAQDESMTEPVVMGPLATREWQAGDVTNKPYGDQNYCRDAAGYTHWRAARDDGAVVIHYLDGYDKNAWRYAGEAWAQNDDLACPWVSSCDDGSLLCGVTNTLTATTGIKRSRDGGATWGNVMATLGEDLIFGKGLTFMGQTYLPGWFMDKVWLAVSSRDDLARETLDGVNFLLEVCAAPMVIGEQTPLSHVTLQDTGAIDVHVDDGAGGIRTYRCTNPLNGFTLLT